MYATGNKKMLNMLILEILKEYSDEEHRLTQREIIRLLQLNYGMECDRRSVKNNILCLKELGYEISMDDGYYLMEREFEDAELRMLIDAVLFSKHMTVNQARTLIEKLKKQSNRYFQAKVSHVCNLPDLQHGDNAQLLYVLDAINDAISEGRKISFIYNDYGTDFKLHPRRDEAYIVSPYQMVANHGFYYLIGSYDKYDDISHYRLDRMTGVKLLEEKVKDQRRIRGLEHGLNLPKHMAEHIYMFGGDSTRVQLLVEKSVMNELVDWFGRDFQVADNGNDYLTVSLTINEDAMFYWALQYGQCVEVLKPQGLRDRIAEAVSEMSKRYSVRR